MVAPILMRRPFLQPFVGNGLVVLLAFSIFSGCDQSPATNRADSATGNTGIVRLEIQFGGKQKDLSVEVPCSTDSTVFQLMERARDRGDLDFISSGTGEIVFVSSIKGVENEGASGDNWVFRVNDKLGDKSCGVFSVHSGDHVLWVLGEYP